MKNLLIIVFIILSLQQLFSQETEVVEWRNIKLTYESLDSIIPFMYNKGDSSIYFISAWPFVSANVLRFNEFLKKWEWGTFRGLCFVIENPSEPIELKSGDSIEINLDIVLAVDTIENEIIFILEDYETLRPLKGKYKLVIYYAHE